jgi:hypothetical protein
VSSLDFEYQTGSAGTPQEAQNDSWATQDFEAGVPMESNVDEFIQYPWEATPDHADGGVGEALNSSQGVFPWQNSVVTVLQGRVQEAARDYVKRVEGRLPKEVRDDFVRGAGMFDFPVPDEDVDDQLG